MLKVRENLTGYAHTQYDSTAINAQQGLVRFAQELHDDDLHTRMPDIIWNPGWNRRFKTHNKVNKRLMTGAEASERDANNREKAAHQEARLQQAAEFNGFYNSGLILFSPPPPPPPPPTPPPPSVQLVPNTPPGNGQFREEDSDAEEEKEEEGDEEEAAFVPPPSTAPAKMQLSRAGRKRAPTMKALESEEAPKRGRGTARGARGGRRGNTRR
jgi:hypothetical protein